LKRDEHPFAGFSPHLAEALPGLGVPTRLGVGLVHVQELQDRGRLPWH